MENKLDFNLLDKADLRFHDLRTALDTLCVSLYMLLYINMLLYIIMYVIVILCMLYIVFYARVLYGS